MLLIAIWPNVVCCAFFTCFYLPGYYRSASGRGILYIVALAYESLFCPDLIEIGLRFWFCHL